MAHLRSHQILVIGMATNLDGDGEIAAERTYVPGERGDLDGVRGALDLAHLRLASPPSLCDLRLVEAGRSPSVATTSCSMRRRSLALSRNASKLRIGMADLLVDDELLVSIRQPVLGCRLEGVLSTHDVPPLVT